MNIGQYREELHKKYHAAYALNDSAHRREHFEEVFHNSMHINAKLGISLELVEVKMYAAAAYLHDLFAWSRENHHLLSWKFVESSDCPLLSQFTPKERKEISLMCKEHRSSYRGRYSTRKSEIFSAADYGPPENVSAHLDRATRFAMERNGISRQEALPIAVAHIKEKYGRGGYAVITPLYLSVWGQELEAFYQEIENL